MIFKSADMQSEPARHCVQSAKVIACGTDFGCWLVFTRVAGAGFEISFRSVASLAPLPPLALLSLRPGFFQNQIDMRGRHLDACR
jgi:hypothetical protein